MSARSRFAALAGRFFAASLTAPLSTSSSASCLCSSAAAAAAASAASPSYASASLCFARSFSNPGIRVPVNRNQVSIRIKSPFPLERMRSERLHEARREAKRGSRATKTTHQFFWPPPPPPRSTLFLDADLLNSAQTTLAPNHNVNTTTTTAARSTAPCETSTASARPTTSSPRGAPTGSSPARPSSASSRPRPRRAGSPRGGSRRTCGG